MSSPIRFLSRAFALFAVLTATLAPSVVFACQCRGRQTPATAAERAEVIFVASPRPGRPPVNRGMPLRVTRVYKGAVPAMVELVENDCASPVDAALDPTKPSPGDVLIYGFVAPDGVVVPDMCSRSDLFQDAGEDVAFLEQTFRAAEPAPPASGAARAPAPAASTDASASTDANPVAGARSGAEPATSPPRVPVGPRTGCACEAASAASERGGLGALMLGVAVWIARRRATDRR